MKKKRKLCEWCGSSKHASDHCRLRAKHALLLKGVTPRDAGFVVLDCDSIDDVADKVEAIHTLLS